MQGCCRDAGMMSGCRGGLCIVRGRDAVGIQGCSQDTGMLSGCRDSARIQGCSQDPGTLLGYRDTTGIQGCCQDAGIFSGYWVPAGIQGCCQDAVGSLNTQRSSWKGPAELCTRQRSDQSTRTAGGGRAADPPRRTRTFTPCIPIKRDGPRGGYRATKRQRKPSGTKPPRPPETDGTAEGGSHL